MQTLILIVLIAGFVYIGWILDRNNKLLNSILKPQERKEPSEEETTDEELFEDAIDLVIKENKAAASFLQRRLKIGYARAAQLMDELEEEGIIGPEDGKNPREVYLSKNPRKELPASNFKTETETEEFQSNTGTLVIPLGKDPENKSYYIDLRTAPHLLIGGSTGSGKTNFINNAICALIKKHKPEDLKFVLIDPKQDAFFEYQKNKYLYCDLIYSAKDTVRTLKSLVKEMDNRFNALAAAQVRDLDSYNASQQTKMPFLVVVIDELADPMLVEPTKVEGNIIRLLQMARAVGIHLILATQRPDIETITGLIKANIPTRLAFSTVSREDSRNIIDTAGAERLKGNGDAIYMSFDSTDNIRLQTPLISEEDIKKIVGN